MLKNLTLLLVGMGIGFAQLTWAEGNPEKISEISSSYTGNFLKNIINTKFKKTA